MSKDKEEFSRFNNYEAKVDSRYFTGIFNGITGRIMELIEASALTPEQQNAMKSIAKRFVWEEYDDIQRYLSENGELSKKDESLGVLK